MSEPDSKKAKTKYGHQFAELNQRAGFKMSDAAMLFNFLWLDAWGALSSRSGERFVVWRSPGNISVELGWTETPDDDLKRYRRAFKQLAEAGWAERTKDDKGKWVIYFYKVPKTVESIRAGFGVPNHDDPVDDGRPDEEEPAVAPEVSAVALHSGYRNDLSKTKWPPETWATLVNSVPKAPPWWVVQKLQGMSPNHGWTVEQAVEVLQNSWEVHGGKVNTETSHA